MSPDLEDDGIEASGPRLTSEQKRPGARQEARRVSGRAGIGPANEPGR
jgi:hypothetical protein